MNSVLVEQQQLDDIIQQLGNRAQVEVLETISYRDQQFPIYSIAIGSQRDDVPVIAYFGGVHGLEKIGTEVLLAYLQTLANLLDWDQELNRRLEHARLLFVPIINPVGVFYGTRCNGNGVDLMRNAPIEGIGKTKLYSGHRISPRLPWYRGEP
ncbi:MAG: M14 family zinc carboxypeptidase, partial [Methylomonas sp.]